MPTIALQVEADIDLLLLSLEILRSSQDYSALT